MKWERKVGENTLYIHIPADIEFGSAFWVKLIGSQVHGLNDTVFLYMSFFPHWHFEIGKSLTLPILPSQKRRHWWKILPYSDSISYVKIARNWLFRVVSKGTVAKSWRIGCAWRHADSKEAPEQISKSVAIDPPIPQKMAEWPKIWIASLEPRICWTKACTAIEENRQEVWVSGQGSPGFTTKVWSLGSMGVSTLSQFNIHSWT